MYRKHPDYLGQPARAVMRIADEVSIPFDPANTDYAAYLKWLDAGNSPLLAEGNQPLPSDSVAEETP